METRDAGRARPERRQALRVPLKSSARPDPVRSAGTARRRGRASGSRSARRTRRLSVRWRNPLPSARRRAREASPPCRLRPVLCRRPPRRAWRWRAACRRARSGRSDRRRGARGRWAGRAWSLHGAACLLHRPIPRHALMHREAFLGAADGGEKQFVEAFGPVGVQQQLPAGDGAGDGDGVRRRVVGWSRPRGFDCIERSGGRRPARAVDGDDLAAAGRRVEAEAIAAEARRLRLDDREHRAGRNRGVDGVAAGAQHIDRGQRGDRHGGRRHSIHGIDGAASALVEVSQFPRPFRCRRFEPTMFSVQVKPVRASFCNPSLHVAICMDLASRVESDPVKGSSEYGV